jgi:hypothetical protein
MSAKIILAQGCKSRISFLHTYLKYQGLQIEALTVEYHSNCIVHFMKFKSPNLFLFERIEEDSSPWKFPAVLLSPFE